jgi:putative membrane protein (TIGR04086 family)
MVKEAGEGIKSALPGEVKLISILKGVLVSYVITIPTFVVFAFILSNTNYPEKYIMPVVIITTVISILFAGLTATKSIRSKGWLNGAIVGLLYVCILYMLSSIVFKDFSIDKNVVSISILGALAGIAGGIIGVNLKKNSKLKRRKY